MHLFMHFAIEKFILYSATVNIYLAMLKAFHDLLGLFPVWNNYPKGSYTAGATKRSIIAYDEFEDRISTD